MALTQVLEEVALTEGQMKVSDLSDTRKIKHKVYSLCVVLRSFTSQ